MFSRRLFVVTAIVLTGLIITASPSFSADGAKKAVAIDEFPSPEGGMSALMALVKYPSESLRDSIQGRVLINFKVDSLGNVSDVSVKKGLHRDIDSVALDAVKKVKWNPAKKDGKPVSIFITVPFEFKLDKKK